MQQQKNRPRNRITVIYGLDSSLCIHLKDTKKVFTEIFLTKDSLNIKILTFE